MTWPSLCESTLQNFTQVTFFNSVADLLGFTPAEIVGKSWYHFQHACDLDTALACHKTCK